MKLVELKFIMAAGCEGQEASSEELYDQLVSPLLQHIRNSRIVLVPHAELHYIPFAALRDRATGRYLVEDLTLSYAPSASVLEFLRGKETPVAGRAIVLGNPAAGDSELGSLEWAEWEAEAVARRLDVEPLLGPDATEERLMGAGEVDLMHLAAHSIYEPESPLFSRILLAARNAPSGDPEPPLHDGSLTVDEIFARLDLAGVNLVVLSACRTARGQRSGGDEIVGLTRALLYAGSPGVISTLWGIDDQTSATLMDEFYRLWTEGVPIARALQQAQLTVLRTPDFSAPYYWAAFSLTGDPQGLWPRPTKKGHGP